MHTPTTGLSELFMGFRRKIIERAKRHSLKHELTFSQFEVLWFIGLRGKKSMEAIAEFLKITPPSATSMIGKMEGRGLVRRMQDSKDRRVMYISLTPRIERQLSTIRKQKEKLFDKLISKLTAIDRKHLERIIRILIED